MEEHKITLNELKEDVDRLVQEGHGHRAILMWTGEEDEHYKKLHYRFSIPDNFDQAIHGEIVDPKTTILLG